MKIQWHPITKTYWKLLLHGRNLANVKNYNKKDIELTLVWEFNGINLITKTYWKLLLHGKNLTADVCKVKRT